MARLELNPPSTGYWHVIEFWFGELPMEPESMTDRHKLRYGFDAATDTLIVVLDQFARNIHRGRAGAFDGDAPSYGQAFATR